MKRWWLSVAVILGGCFGLASAEYIIIVANVNPIEKKVGPDGKGLPPVGLPMPPPTGGLTTPTVNLKEFEEKIVIAILPLENTLTLGQQTQLARTMVQIPYESKLHAHLLSLDLVTKNLGKVRVGSQVFRANDVRSLTGRPLDIPAHLFLKKQEELTKLGKPTAEKLKELAEWALGHGLNKEVGLVIADLEKIDKDNPWVTGYQKLQEALKVQLAEDPQAPQRLALTKPRQSANSAHFTLWWTKDIVKINMEAQSRLERLEDALQTYYLWWLLKGVTLPLPAYRLTVFLDGREDEFKARHATLTFRRELTTAKDLNAVKNEEHVQSALTTAPLVSGGYYARRENVTVLSLKRIDSSYDLVSEYCLGQAIWEKQGERDKLLTGAAKPTTDLVEFYEAQSFALMLRLLEEDAERASISHNVSRQLAVASGLLPQGVAAPEWVEFGLGSFFETPLNAPWASPTDQNSLYRPIFNKLVHDKRDELKAKPGELLKMVVRDGYFRDPPADKAELPATTLRKARATSWSLMYFLAQEPSKRVQLRAFFAELSRLPRDMEITDEVLLRCFCRAFGLWDETNQHVNDAAAQQLQNHWLKYISDAKPEFEELMGAADKYRTAMAKATATAEGAPNTGQPVLPPR